MVEPHPAIRTVLEYLLAREGYSVEVGTAGATPGPALMVVSARDGGGLYVFECEDAAGTLERPPDAFPGATGIRAFLPKPFGADDVLRTVRTVGAFDGRRKPRALPQASGFRLQASGFVEEPKPANPPRP